jgi:hypothetical protein
MTSGQDVSEFLDILGLVKSYFSSFFGEKKSRIFVCGAPDAPEDQAICLFAGLLANPDMTLNQSSPHRIGSPNSHSDTGSPSRISNLCFRVPSHRTVKPALTTTQSVYR